MSRGFVIQITNLFFVQLTNCLAKNFVPGNRGKKITSNGRCPFEVSRFSLRPALLPPQGVGRNTLSAQSVFRHAHVAAKNDSNGSPPAGGEFCEAFGSLHRSPRPVFPSPKIFWKKLQKGLAKRKGLCYTAYSSNRELLERTAPPGSFFKTDWLVSAN